VSIAEVMAVTALRRWWQDRVAARCGRTVSYKRQGWTERRARDFDARITRCIDFERVLGALTAQHQTVLLLVYRDNISLTATAAITAQSVGAVRYQLSAARWALYEALDRSGLL
jgi:DNA-directed RNA polymerase specialized sigma24 family protein